MDAAGQVRHHPTTTEILQLFHERGASQYGRESVAQQEHALQAAHFAELSRARAALVVAALLHDVGHLLHALPDDAPEHGIDDVHEEVAGRWLEQRFGPEVVEPVRLHVAAKRYLVATDPDYLRQLSPPSILSLSLQGGAMSPGEVKAFQSHPHYAAAVALRRWDDAAKIPRLVTPPIDHFARYINDILQACC